MRKWSGFAAVVCGIVLALLAGVGEFSASGSGGSLPSPSFRPSPGWVSLTTGTSNTRDWEGVWAVTARSNLAALAPFDLPNNLRHLSRDAVYISAQTEGRGGAKREFPALEWPLRLSHFRNDHGWEVSPRQTCSNAFGGGPCAAGTSTSASISRHSIRPSAYSGQHSVSSIVCSSQAAKHVLAQVHSRTLAVRGSPRPAKGGALPSRPSSGQV